eukprot:g91.t1
MPFFCRIKTNKPLPVKFSVLTKTTQIRNICGKTFVAVQATQSITSLGVLLTWMEAPQSEKMSDSGESGAAQARSIFSCLNMCCCSSKASASAQKPKHVSGYNALDKQEQEEHNKNQPLIEVEKREIPISNVRAPMVQVSMSPVRAVPASMSPPSKATEVVITKDTETTAVPATAPATQAIAPAEPQQQPAAQVAASAPADSPSGPRDSPADRPGGAKAKKNRNRNQRRKNNRGKK